MDENEIVKSGVPEPAWITPDGKFITTDPVEAKANGATHQVTASLAVYADGRKQWIVYHGADRSLGPGTFSPAGPQAGYDDKQRGIFNQSRGPAERKPTRTYTGVDPATNKPANVSEWPDGAKTYEEIKPPATKTPEEIANTQATTANTRATTASTIKEEAEKDAHAAAGHGRLTDVQWQAELTRRETAARAAGNQEEVNRIARERLAFDREPKPKIEEIDLPNGRKGTRVTVVPVGGGAATITNYDENGKPLSGMPAPRVAAPPGAPNANLTLGQITQGLSDYSSWLNEQTRLWQSSNGTEGMAPDAATKAMETRRSLATSAISEQTGIANAQGEIRGQDITQRGQTLSETASRRGTARDIYNNTLNQFIPQMKFLAPGREKAAAFVGAMNEVNQNALGYANAWGGLRETPPVPTVGFLNDVRTMAGPGPGQAMAGPPTMFQSRPMPGAPGTVAGAPPAAPPDPTAAAATMANPAFRPPPPEPPVAPAMNPVNAAPITVPARPLPTPEPPLVPTPSLGPGQDLSTPMPAMPAQPAASPPDYGAPGMRVLPPPADPNLGQPGDPQWQLPPGEVTMAPSFLQQARYGQQYDPVQTAMQRIMNGANPEFVSAAFEEMYGRPLQMAG